MLVFYYAPGASSMAVHIALHEVGAEFEGRPLSFARREQREPGYLRLNPLGQVPTLDVGGAILTEVAACLFYLARAYPAGELLPTGPLAEAQIVSWMSFLASSVHPARRLGIDVAKRVWSVAERRLDGQPWAADQYSIADIHLFRLFWRASASLPFDERDLPALFDHKARMLDRAAVRKTIMIEAAIGYELPA